MNYQPLTSEAAATTVGSGSTGGRWGMSRTNKTLVALAAAAIVLVLAGWFDSTVMSEARSHAAATFDISGVAATIALGSLFVAGSVLLVGTLAWRTASVVVGLAYVVVGGFFVALPSLVWNLASQVNDVPPVLPEPLASALGNIYFSTTGSLNAVGTIGAAMLFAGAAAFARRWRGRAVSASRAEVIVPTADPTLP
jgi:hypothetical protein